MIIWKAREWIHEFNSVDILKEKGLKELSEIVLHWFVYEHFKLKWKEDKSFLPKSLEQKTLCLADMYCYQNQRRVNIDERFNDILERYTNNSEFTGIVKLAKIRMLNLEKEISNFIK